MDYELPPRHLVKTLHGVLVAIVSCLPLVTSTSASATGSGEASSASGVEVATGRTSVNDCVNAHAAAQELRQGGQLLDCRDKLLQCSREVCPGLVRDECLQLLDQIGAEIPSVVFRITVDGEKRLDVHATVDGKELLSEVPTRAVEMDPGMHRFVMSKMLRSRACGMRWDCCRHLVTLARVIGRHGSS